MIGWHQCSYWRHLLETCGTPPPQPAPWTSRGAVPETGCHTTNKYCILFTSCFTLVFCMQPQYICLSLVSIQYCLFNSPQQLYHSYPTKSWLWLGHLVSIDVIYYIKCRKKSNSLPLGVFRSSSPHIACLEQGLVQGLLVMFEEVKVIWYNGLFLGWLLKPIKLVFSSVQFLKAACPPELDGTW